MLFTYLLLLITIFTDVNAEPANKEAVQAFLDCLNFHNASNIYAYVVSEPGYLRLAPLQDTNLHSDVDIKPYDICNYMFGISIYCSFDFGIRTFHPTWQLKKLDGVTAQDLIDEGLLARERSNVFNNDEETRLSHFLAYANNLGFNADQIREVLGFDPNPSIDKMN